MRDAFGGERGDGARGDEGRFEERGHGPALRRCPLMCRCACTCCSLCMLSKSEALADQQNARRAFSIHYVVPFHAARSDSHLLHSYSQCTAPCASSVCLDCFGQGEGHPALCARPSRPERLEGQTWYIYERGMSCYASSCNVNVGWCDPIQSCDVFQCLWCFLLIHACGCETDYNNHCDWNTTWHVHVPMHNVSHGTLYYTCYTILCYTLLTYDILHYAILRYAMI